MSKAATSQLPEVLPDQADPVVAELYERIRGTLRVPFVNLLFRGLAALGAGSLGRLWDAVEPLAEDRAFEAAADALRAEALLAGEAPELDPEALAGGDAGRRIRGFTDTIHYVLPKLLLVATAAQAGTPERVVPRSGERHPLPRGVAPGAVALAMVDPEAAEGDVAGLLAAICERHGHPAVPSYYRALGHWPGVLRTFWAHVEPLVGAPRFVERREHLVQRATAQWRELAPLAGLLRPPLPGSAWDETLGWFRRRLVPEMLLEVSWIEAGLRGGGGALSLPSGVSRREDRGR